MDATTEQPDTASAEAPQAEEPTTTDAPTDPDAATSDVDDDGYQVLSQLKICYLHIHVGLTTRKPEIIDQFVSDFSVFLVDYQRGTTPLPVVEDKNVGVERYINRWPARKTALGLSVHTTDFLTDEQRAAFDEALYAMLKSQPVVKWGSWHEGGLSLEMGVISFPPES